MVVFEAISSGIVETPMGHHPLCVVLLTCKGTTFDVVVGLGWYAPEKISGAPKGLLRRVRNSP